MVEEPIHTASQELRKCLCTVGFMVVLVFPLPKYLINSQKLSRHQCVYLFTSLKLIYLTSEKQDNNPCWKLHGVQIKGRLSSSLSPKSELPLTILIWLLSVHLIILKPVYGLCPSIQCIYVCSAYFCMCKALRIPTEVTQVTQHITVSCCTISTALRHHKKNPCGALYPKGSDYYYTHKNFLKECRVLEQSK